MGMVFSDPRCFPVATGEGPSRAKTCPVCGKTYAMACRETEWAYRFYASRNKRRYVCVCSYGCKIKIEREKEREKAETAPTRAHTDESRRKQRESLHRYMEQRGDEIRARAAAANREKMKELAGKNGWKIANAMLEKDITQKQLAERAGISQGSISAYIHGRQKPRPEQIERLAAALGIEPDALIKE